MLHGYRTTTKKKHTKTIPDNKNWSKTRLSNYVPNDDSFMEIISQQNSVEPHVFFLEVFSNINYNYKMHTLEL